MAAVQTGTELAIKMIDIATNYKSVYALGMWGLKVEESTIASKTQQLPEWYTTDRQRMLRNLIGQGYWGFDCVCTIKAILWGWTGDTSSISGGAVYASNGVPDIGANQMITVCSNVSTDFSNILVGELCWMEGHVGVYVGDGLSVECTPRWANKVQFTACNRVKTGYNTRTWTKHGRLPYVSYDAETPDQPAPSPVPQPQPIPKVIVEAKEVPVAPKPTRTFTDKQWYNFICGLIAGRYSKYTTPELGDTATLPVGALETAYYLEFITDEDGDTENQGHVSVYLRGSATAPSIALESLKVEVAPTNPAEHVDMLLTVATGGSTQDYFLNYCPMNGITVDDTTGLTVIQEYSPAKLKTNESGAMSIIRQKNLVVEMNNDIQGSANCCILLFTLTCTWAHDATLILQNPYEEKIMQYLAGNIQMEAGFNSVYRYDNIMYKLRDTAMPCWLQFGDPASVENQKALQELAERNPGLPAGAEIPTYPSERPTRNVTHITYGYDSHSLGYGWHAHMWPRNGGAGAGGWVCRRGTGYSRTRHTIVIPSYISDIVTIDAKLTVRAINEETGEEHEVDWSINKTPHISPFVPTNPYAKKQEKKAKFRLIDFCEISVIAPVSPDTDEHLVIHDNAEITVVAPPPTPEVEEHLQIIDGADISVVAPPPTPEVTDGLSLTDSTDIDVYTPPIPEVTDGLSLTDSTEINVYTPPTPSASAHLQIEEGIAVNITSGVDGSEINIHT